MSGEKCKEKGNEYFQKGKFRAAIDMYTEAICMDANVSMYYTNRALCHRRLDEYEAMVSDCQKAIALDSSNLKGSYLLGVAYTHLDSLRLAVETFQACLKAVEKGLYNEATKKKYKHYIQEIHIELRRAKKQLHQQHLGVKVDVLARLKKSFTETLQVTLKADENGEELTRHAEALFKEQEELLCPKMPEYFCCPVSMDIMLDPVITPSGLSYDRNSIEAHIQRNGPTDPVTRETLTLSMLYPNVGLRQAIEDYLERNPLAFES